MTDSRSQSAAAWEESYRTAAQESCRVVLPHALKIPPPFPAHPNPPFLRLQPRPSISCSASASSCCSSPSTTTIIDRLLAPPHLLNLPRERIVAAHVTFVPGLVHDSDKSFISN